MESTYTLMFYLKKEKGYKSGPITINARITVNGVPAEFSTGQKCDPARWDRGEVIGRTEESKSLQNYLDTISRKIRDHHRELLETAGFVSSAMLKNAYLGKNDRPTSVVKVFTQHNKDMAKLVACGEVAAGTLERYETTLSHTIEFMRWKYNLPDMDIRQIDLQFVTQYEFFLKTVRKCCHNTSVKYVENFGKIIRICFDNNWIKKNPFALYKSKIEKVDPVFLKRHELIAVISKEFHTKRLEYVRDVFVFCCFTGLAYADVKKLKRSEVCIGINGKLWIEIKRKKTAQDSKVPLLPIAEGLIKKYADHPDCVAGDKLFPVKSNQKMNEYLHEIADLCSVDKDITSHTARHTFGTTVTLGFKVPLDTVKKMMGHANRKMTEHYARVVDEQVGEDMLELAVRNPLATLTPQAAAG